MSAEPANAEPWQLVGEPEPKTTPAEQRWRRLVRSLYRVRRLQRIWAHLGRWLQEFDSSLRKQLQNKLK